MSEIVSGLEGDRARVLRMGSEEQFSHLCGSYAYLLQEHRLDLGGLLERLREKGIDA